MTRRSCGRSRGTKSSNLRLVPEGTHLLAGRSIRRMPWGWKCLARAISDVAAMGGAPPLLPASVWPCQRRTSAGGSICSWRLAARCLRSFQCGWQAETRHGENEILINNSRGEVASRSACCDRRRSDDILYVSGGWGSGLGLQIVRRTKGSSEQEQPADKKAPYPEPRLALGQWVVQKGLGDRNDDLSDGTSSDLPRLCRLQRGRCATGKGKDSAGAIRGISLSSTARSLQLALHGGDDYELLFTVPPRKGKPPAEVFSRCALTPIGKSPKSECCWCWKRTAERVNSRPALGPLPEKL